MLPLTRIAGWLDGLTIALSAVAAAMLAGTVASYCYEVAARFFFNAPTEWANDVVTYLLAGAIFLAAPDVARTGGHIAIALLVERLGEARRAVVIRLLAAASTVATLGAAWIVGSEAIRQFEQDILTLGVHPIPKGLITGTVAFGLFLTALQFLRHALLTAKPEEAR
ncbi:TRAP transporter small permease [Ferrovibrio sp.]|uniref:TRAP transporter small permease n=1 Tax=Ferrovibrio sp. TaxID=1917215 RepID=UPI00261FE636|nr:TRAP transporter small permease [Ferrovibrio sp.]